MKRSLSTRITALFSCCLLLFSSALPAIGSIHPLSVLEHNGSSGVSDIDITISLDWDPDKVTDTTTVRRGWTKAEMEQAVDGYAASLFAMTNGLHRLRNVYIFRSKKSWASADIVFVSTKAGRSNANIAAWGTPAQKITMYTYMQSKGTYSPEDSPGPVLAHETGHYLYGLLDEYREGAGTNSYTISQLKQRDEYHMPATDDDDSQQSIMNEHWNYPNWFSTAESYEGATASGAVSRKMTAHYRNYGKSIWDTLTSAPNSDPAAAQSFGRTQFEAFKGKSVATAKDLKASITGNLSGYNAALKVVWADAPILGLVMLDPNIPDAKWGEVREAVGTIIQNAPADSYLQVMSGSSTAIARTRLTEANRSSLAAQAGTVARGGSIGLEAVIRAALEEVKKYRATLTSYQASSIYLLAGSNPLLPVSLMRELRQANVALKVLYNTANAAPSAKSTARAVPKVVRASDSGLSDDEMVYLSQISRETGGSFSTARTSSEMETGAMKASTGGEGDDMAVISGSNADSLPAGGKHDLTFMVGNHDELVTVALMASAQDFTKLSPSLSSPDGSKILAGSLPAGIMLVPDQESGSWYFVIDPSVYAGARGTWVATLSATGGAGSDIAIMAAAQSQLRMQLDVKQRPGLGNLLEVALRLDRPVLKAAVRADVYDAKGDLVRSGLQLVDDGSNGDLNKNDGIYTVALNNLVPGEYSFLVTANDNNGQAIASDQGTFFSQRGEKIVDEPTGSFQRMDEGTFAVPVQQSSGDGGCVVGRGGSADLLLLLTVIFPVLSLAWSLRRRSGGQA